MEETQKYINDKFCEKLKIFVDKLYGMILYERHCFANRVEVYEILRDIAILSGELFDSRQNRDEFEELLRSTAVDGEQYRAKSETFRMLRNFMIHFPIFETWEEIFVTKNMLRWNNDKTGAIEKYFDNNAGKILKFSIYTRKDYFYDKKRDFKVAIPKLEGLKKIYLKDIISLEDAMWLFALIGYYLEWKNWTIEPDERYFGLISA